MGVSRIRLYAWVYVSCVSKCVCVNVWGGIYDCVFLGGGGDVYYYIGIH